MSEVKRVNLQLADGQDRTCVWETEHLQIMRVRMPVGEALPTHNSNSHVLITPLAGQVRVVTAGQDDVVGVGEAVSVPFDTRMDVSNGGDAPATFLVIKAPHPKGLQ